MHALVWIGVLLIVLHFMSSSLFRLCRRKVSERLEAAEAAAALLKEELTETRQAVSWREEELVKMRKANADSEVR